MGQSGGFGGSCSSNSGSVGGHALTLVIVGLPGQGGEGSMLQLLVTVVQKGGGGVRAVTLVTVGQSGGSCCDIGHRGSANRGYAALL